VTELTGRIGVICDALEHLLTFHYNTFFTLLFILENAYKTSFFKLKTVVCLKSAALALRPVQFWSAANFVTRVPLHRMARMPTRMEGMVMPLEEGERIVQIPGSGLLIWTKPRIINIVKYPAGMRYSY
jgi:hypothetical protein